MWTRLIQLFFIATLLTLGGCGSSGSSSTTTPTPPTPAAGNISVAFTMTPNSGVAPLTISLDASATVSNTGRPLSSYAWSASDATGTEVQTASGKVTTMAFVAAGNYTIKLTASDDQARYGVGQQTLTLTAQSTDTTSPATAVIAVSDGAQPLSVVLDASGSRPATGAYLVSYGWTVADSAGNTLETTSGVTSTVVFAAEGTYTVTLTVTDSKGNTGTARQNVTVAYAQTLQASFSITPSTGTVPFDIALDGSASEANGLQIRNWAWSLADEKGAEVQTATGKTTTMAIVTAGSYVITLTVTDEFGRTAVAHRAILANAPTTP